MQHLNQSEPYLLEELDDTSYDGLDYDSGAFLPNYSAPLYMEGPLLGWGDNNIWPYSSIPPETNFGFPGPAVQSNHGTSSPSEGPDGPITSKCTSSSRVIARGAPEPLQISVAAKEVPVAPAGDDLEVTWEEVDDELPANMVKWTWHHAIWTAMRSPRLATRTFHTIQEIYREASTLKAMDPEGNTAQSSIRGALGDTTGGRHFVRAKRGIYGLEAPGDLNRAQLLLAIERQRAQPRRHGPRCRLPKRRTK